MSPPRQLTAHRRIVPALALGLLLLATALALPGAARAQGGSSWELYPCVPTFFDRLDPRGAYYANGTGDFGWDGSALTIATSQPIASLARWLSHTTLIAAGGCSPALPQQLAGLDVQVVATMRTTDVVGGYASLALTYWDANQQFIGSQSSTTTPQPGWVGTPSAASLSGTTDWTSVTAAGVVPAGTKYVRLEFRLAGPGRLWIRSANGYFSSFGHIDNVTPPSIGGTARVGELLTAYTGTWSPYDPLVHNAFFFEWLRCDLWGLNCQVIPDAGGGSIVGPFVPELPWNYTVRPADVGSTIRVRVTLGTEDAASDPVLSAPTRVVVAAGGQLAPDPDLEADPAPFYLSNGPGRFSWATDQSHSATHSLKIESNTSTLARWLTQARAIHVLPGASYDVSAWLKTLGGGAEGSLSVNFWTDSGTYIPATVDSARVLATQDWTQRTLHVTAPPGAAFLRVEYRLNGPGTLWADDLSVTAG